MKEFGINRKLEYDDGFLHRTLKEIEAKQSSSALLIQLGRLLRDCILAMLR